MFKTPAFDVELPHISWSTFRLLGTRSKHVKKWVHAWFQMKRSTWIQLFRVWFRPVFCVCEINVWTSWTSCTWDETIRQGASPAWMSRFDACRLVTGDPQNSERRKGSNEIHRKLVFVHGLVPTLLAFQHLWDKESLLVPWFKKKRCPL